jgi:alkylation response protein AidB-like acyl-CoA dehydrogenase
MIAAAPSTLEECRTGFRAWLAQNREEVEACCRPRPDVAGMLAGLRSLQRLLFEAGWIRIGWDESVGGLGGRPVMRSVVGEELAAAGYPPPFSFATQEVLGPAVAHFARPELAAHVMPRLLRGDEAWCQGFSEPGAGSDLASLQLKAVPDGDGFVLTGEKIWTSWAQYADRCVLLARTGTPESGHRGITAFLLDMGTDGIEVSPLRSMDGDSEFCSLHLDAVRVPDTRVLGEVNGGWALAMFVLAGERGAAAWQRQAWLRSRLDALAAEPGLIGDARLGEALELLHAMRLLSRRTVRALSDGQSPGVAPSLDKLAMSTAEKFLFESVMAAHPGRLVLGGDDESRSWRKD